MTFLSDIKGDFDNADYYDCSDPEQLSHSDPSEAIEYALDLMDADPETIEVIAYRRIAVDIPDLASRLLDDAIERLDETLGDPGGDPFEPTVGMKVAALSFAQYIAAEYMPWQCEPCGSAIANVAAWRASEGMPREEP